MRKRFLEKKRRDKYFKVSIKYYNIFIKYIKIPLFYIKKNIFNIDALFTKPD